jgi:hypothetical protein
MSNSCSNQNEVFQFFNLMHDGRSFTDYRSQSEVYNTANKRASDFCKNSNNSYDTRICLQRNAGLIFREDNNSFNSTFNLPKCAKTNSANCNANKNN